MGLGVGLGRLAGLMLAADTAARVGAGLRERTRAISTAEG